MDVIKSGYFFWIVGFAVGQVYYLIDAPFFNVKRLHAFLYGVINLVLLCVGAKLMYIIENFGYVLENGLGFQGFSLFGAIFILPLSCLVISLLFRHDYRSTASFIVIPFIIMLAFYRIDCLISGCCGGITINGVRVPTQITECVFCFVLAGIYIAVTHKKRLLGGQCFALFFIIYGLFRFVMEFFRERSDLFLCFSLSHIWAVLSVIIGVVIMSVWRKRYGKA